MDDNKAVEETELDQEQESVEIEVEVDASQETDIEAEEATESEDESETQDSEDEEVVISFDDEDSPPQEREEAPQWVKDLRKENRELKKQLKKEAAKHEPQPETKLRDKPKLADFDFDDIRYENDLDNWYQEKREYDKAQEKILAEQEEQNKIWEAKAQAYEASKAKLTVSDYDEAEFTVSEKLTPEQRGIIIGYAENPSVLVYALGNNSERLEQLSQIKDPIAFALQISKMQGEVKMRTKTKPAPEKKVVGKAASAKSLEAQLDELRLKAESSNDLTEVLKFKKKHNL